VISSFGVKSLLLTIFSGYYRQALGRAFIKSVCINIIIICNVCAIMVPQLLVISCFLTYHAWGQIFTLDNSSFILSTSPRKDFSSKVFRLTVGFPSEMASALDGHREIHQPGYTGWHLRRGCLAGMVGGASRTTSPCGRWLSLGSWP